MMVATDNAPGKAPLTFDAFFRIEYPRLVRMVRALCRDPQRAEELAQDALAQAHAQWERVSTYDSPGAWVRRVALNLSANAHRNRRREVAAIERLTPSDRANVVELADGNLWRAVRSLPEQQRSAVVLFYIADTSVADIAEVLKCSQGSVKTHLSRARHTLAVLLSAQLEPR